jgi:hypothetical protein
VRSNCANDVVEEAEEAEEAEDVDAVCERSKKLNTR